MVATIGSCHIMAGCRFTVGISTEADGGNVVARVLTMARSKKNKKPLGRSTQHSNSNFSTGTENTFRGVRCWLRVAMKYYFQQVCPTVRSIDGLAAHILQSPILKDRGSSRFYHGC
jgi:hypothetical protein